MVWLSNVVQSTRVFGHVKRSSDLSDAGSRFDIEHVQWLMVATGWSDGSSNISRWFARWAGDHADNAAGKVRGYEDLCRAVQGERLYAAGINGRNRCNL